MLALRPVKLFTPTLPVENQSTVLSPSHVTQSKKFFFQIKIIWLTLRELLLLKLLGESAFYYHLGQRKGRDLFFFFLLKATCDPLDLNFQLLFSPASLGASKTKTKQKPKAPHMSQFCTSFLVPPKAQTSSFLDLKICKLSDFSKCSIHIVVLR